MPNEILQNKNGLVGFTAFRDLRTCRLDGRHHEDGRKEQRQLSTAGDHLDAPLWSSGMTRLRSNFESLLLGKRVSHRHAEILLARIEILGPDLLTACAFGGCHDHAVVEMQSV